MTKKLLTLENIRSGAVPSDAHAVGFLLGEVELLRALVGRMLPYVQQWKPACAEELIVQSKLEDEAERVLYPAHEPSEQQLAREDLAYYEGARAAAAMAHQSLSVMDKWINAGCGGRWQEAKAAQGASRDASNHDQGSLTEAGCSPAAQSCEWTATAGNPDDGSKRTSPASLVGALQDVVHTDPGPVRAAAAVKSIECPQCFGDKQIAMSDWTSRICEYCGGTGRATLRTLLQRSEDK